MSSRVAAAIPRRSVPPRPLARRGGAPRIGFFGVSDLTIVCASPFRPAPRRRARRNVFEGCCCNPPSICSSKTSSSSRRGFADWFFWRVRPDNRLRQSLRARAQPPVSPECLRGLLLQSPVDLFLQDL